MECPSSLICVLAVLLPQVFSASAAAQDGHIDMSFNPGDTGLYGDGSGPLGHVARVFDLGPEGYLLLGGGPYYNGQHTPGLIRISPSGVLLDGAWGPSPATGGYSDMASSQQGGYYVGGWFTSSTNPVMTNLMRLTDDGLHDLSFLPTAFPNGNVVGVFPSPDGSVLVEGFFTQVGDSSRNGWAHFAADGSLTGLDLASDVVGNIACAMFASDGDLVIGGDFTSVQGLSIKRLARFDPTGHVDTTFAEDGGPNGPVSALELGLDGTLYITGNFSAYAGTQRAKLARVFPTGQLDVSFDPGQSTDFPVEFLRAGVDGTLLIAGGFIHYQGAACDGMALLAGSGSPLLLVGTGSGTSGDLLDVVYRPGERIIIAGYVNRWLEEPCRYMEALVPDGSVDPDFNACTGANEYVGALAVCADGRIMIGGAFTRYDGIPRRGIARLESDGALDISFDPGDGADGAVGSISVLPDGRLLLAGAFNHVQGVERGGLARLFPNGLLDTTFHTSFGAYPSCVHILPDERILVGGAFQLMGDTVMKPVLMLHPDGTVDGSFDAGTNENGFPVRQILTQPDGQILVAGQFIDWNGTAGRGIVRLNPDGSRDLSFDVGTGPNGDVRGLALQPDGRILIAGSFSSVNGAPAWRVARLEPSGAVDVAFSTAGGPGASLGADVVAVDPVGRILLAGSFGFFGSVSTWPVVRLLPDGSRDPDFFMSPVQGYRVSELVRQADGTILVGGQFTSLAGVPRNRIARLGTGWLGFATEETSHDVLRFFPNPAQDLVTIESNTALGAVQLLDATGRVVMESSTRAARLTIGTDQLRSGLYFVRLTDERGTRAERLMIER